MDTSKGLAGSFHRNSDCFSRPGEETIVPMDALNSPLSVHYDFHTGQIKPCESYRQVHLSDMRGYYLADRKAPNDPLKEDPVLYEVFECTVPMKPGEMVPCSTIIHAGAVGDEFYMTKGHYHSNANAAEIYCCLQGHGLLLMQHGGRLTVETMKLGALIYVPAGWAHRSVNVGAEDLVIFAIYPADAGHDYRAIREKGFLKRVLRGPDGAPVLHGES
jgi:glucose-6-phosphate isomerase